MIKNQKGVTISMLAVTIIVLSIMAGITISIGTNLVKSSRLRNYITTMSLIKLEVEKTFEEFEFENIKLDDIKGVVETSGIDWKNSVLKKENDSIIINPDKSVGSALNIDENTPVIQQVSQDTALDIIPEGEEKNAIKASVTQEKNNGIDAEDLWFRWYGPILNSLKIEHSNMFDAGDNADDIYFLINYATGEVIYPKGYKTSDKKMIYSLSGLIKLSEESSE